MTEVVWNYEVAEEVAKRLDALLEGLDQNAARAALEELMDDYAYGTFGTNVMEHLRKVKKDGSATSIQPLARGRALLISSYGFNVKHESKCSCGRAFLVLDEKTEEDRNKEWERL